MIGQPVELIASWASNPAVPWPKNATQATAGLAPPLMTSKRRERKGKQRLRYTSLSSPALRTPHWPVGTAQLMYLVDNALVDTTSCHYVYSRSTHTQIGPPRLSSYRPLLYNSYLTTSHNSTELTTCSGLLLVLDHFLQGLSQDLTHSRLKLTSARTLSISLSSRAAPVHLPMEVGAHQGVIGDIEPRRLGERPLPSAPPHCEHAA